MADDLPSPLTADDTALARAIAGGIKPDRLAAAHGIEPARLRRKMADAAFNAEVERARDRLRVALESHRVVVESLAPKAIANLEAVLDNPKHRKNVEVSQYILDRTLPQQQASDRGTSGVRIEASEEAVAEIGAALRMLAQSRPGETFRIPRLEDDPNLVDK